MLLNRVASSNSLRFFPSISEQRGLKLGTTFSVFLSKSRSIGIAMVLVDNSKLISSWVNLSSIICRSQASTSEPVSYLSSVTPFPFSLAGKEVSPYGYEVDDSFCRKVSKTPVAGPSDSIIIEGRDTPMLASTNLEISYTSLVSSPMTMVANSRSIKSPFFTSTARATPSPVSTYLIL